MRNAPIRLLLILAASSLLTACSTTLALRKGDKQYAYGEYYAASVQYGKAFRGLKGTEKALKAHVSYYRGESYRHLNVPVKAENEYRKALRYNFPDDTLYLRLGQTLQKNGKYTEAATHYNRFLDSHPEDMLALNGVYACNRIQKWIKLRPLYQVKKEKALSTKKGNFSPALVPPDYNTLLFTSSAKAKKDKKPSQITGLPDNDFWMTTKDVDNKWVKPTYMEGPLNTDFDEGTCSFSGDGKTLYFTRCVTKSDSIASVSKVELFMSVRTGTDWSEPQKMQVHRDSSVIFAHPAISPDGRYLYYVSDLKGGYGGKDIWRCEVSPKAFGAPENLGPLVNTVGDELFPTLRNDSTVYFSSDGQPGFGGLDIFVANLVRDTVQKVENLLQPLNSEGDDFGITFYGKEDKGYFSSNRKEAKGWDQLWSFEQARLSIRVQGTVRDNNEEVIPDATLRLINDKGLNTKVRTAKNGTYQLQVEKGADYAMLATARSYLNNANRFYALDREMDTAYTVDFTLTPLYRPVRIDNIFFEFNKANLLPESMTALNELNKLLLDNPHIIVEIGAHTDRIGTEEYNDRLSTQRAQAVVDHLVEQGIEKERLVAKGYGKSQPMKVDSRMEKKYSFLKEDTYLDEGYVNTLRPEQQEIADQINRRSEFKVLKTTYKLF